MAHAETLDEARYPADEWGRMLQLLADAESVLDSAPSTQNQIDAPERALSLQLARLGVLAAPAPALDVSLDTAARCVAGKVVLTVRATNAEPMPVSVSIESAFGSKNLGALATGKSATAAFTTRQAAVPAGSVAVQLTATVDGEPLTVPVDEPFAAHSCGS
jgi:hypothetical protein